jgi:hypothetical protein
VQPRGCTSCLAPVLPGRKWKSAHQRNIRLELQPQLLGATAHIQDTFTLKKEASLAKQMQANLHPTHRQYSSDAGATDLGCDVQQALNVQKKDFPEFHEESRIAVQ